MAHNTTITDDLDGTPGASTFYFGFDDNSYEIDLTPENIAKFRAAIQPWIEHARPRKSDFGIA